MARKLRSDKSGSSDSSSKNRSTGHKRPRLRGSARSNNRGNNQQPSLSTQNFSRRSKIVSDPVLQMPKMVRRVRENASRQRSLALLSDLRNGKGSYSQLLREHHLSGRTARKHLGRDLRGGGRGQRVRPSKADRRVRELMFPSSSGDVPARIRGSKAATKLSEFFRDRDKLLRGKLSAYDFEAKWRGVRVSGEEIFADVVVILGMADADVLKLDHLYASTVGAR
jgi:hypothetical protein